MIIKEATVSLVHPDTNHPAEELHSINSNKQITINHRDIFMDQASTQEIHSHHKTHNHLDSLAHKVIYLAVTSNRFLAKASSKINSKTCRYLEEL